MSLRGRLVRRLVRRGGGKNVDGEGPRKIHERERVRAGERSLCDRGLVVFGNDPGMM